LRFEYRKNQKKLEGYTQIAEKYKTFFAWAEQKPLTKNSPSVNTEVKEESIIRTAFSGRKEEREKLLRCMNIPKQ